MLPLPGILSPLLFCQTSYPASTNGGAGSTSLTGRRLPGLRDEAAFLGPDLREVRQACLREQRYTDEAHDGHRQDVEGYRPGTARRGQQLAHDQEREDAAQVVADERLRCGATSFRRARVETAPRARRAWRR